MEIWKDIIGYEGLYQVSNLGRVKSLVRYNKFNKRNEDVVLKQNPYGPKLQYRQVQLSKDGNRKNHKIHRLVAQAFIPNPNNLPYVCHIDDDTTNNSLQNLEWGTQSYNLKQAVARNRWKNRYTR